jgi:hypothetical protein
MTPLNALIIYFKKVCVEAWLNIWMLNFNADVEVGGWLTK